MKKMKKKESMIIKVFCPWAKVSVVNLEVDVIGRDSDGNPIGEMLKGQLVGRGSDTDMILFIDRYYQIYRETDALYGLLKRFLDNYYGKPPEGPFYAEVYAGKFE